MSWCTRVTLGVMVYKGYSGCHGVQGLLWVSWCTRVTLGVMVYKGYSGYHGVQGLLWVSWYTRVTLGIVVPVGSPSRGGDVAVYVFSIN